MTDTEFAPWEQQAEEDGDEWTAFISYRDQGPQRSLMEASRLAGCSKNSCTKWSRAYSWEARVRAWDAEVDRIRRAKFLSEQRRIIKLHAEAAQAVREKAMKAVKLINADMLSEDPDKAIRWLKFATELEAKSVGLPTEVTALALSGGHPKPPEDVYFDSLPDQKLLDIVQMSISTLQKEKGGTHSAAIQSDAGEHDHHQPTDREGARPAGDAALQPGGEPG